jgi:hypothetical protein
MLGVGCGSRRGPTCGVHLLRWRAMCLVISGGMLLRRLVVEGDERSIVMVCT